MDRMAKLKEFLEQNPDDCFILHALALELIKTGEDEKALELFMRILENDEDYIGSYYHLAKLLERLDRTGEAISWYEKGIRKAREKGDLHALNELQSAYDELLD